MNEKTNTMTHDTQEANTLKGLLGQEHFVTPEGMAKAIAYQTKKLGDMISQDKADSPQAGADYLTSGKLARKFGMSECTAWRILRNLMGADAIRVIRYDAPTGEKKSLARYNVADFEKALLVNPNPKSKA